MKIIKTTVALIVLGLTISNCSSDQEIIIEPTPNQEGNGSGNGQPGGSNAEESAEVSLDSIRPLSGPKGTIVTFFGENFGTDASQVKVHINEREMSLVSMSDTEIKIEVLPATYSGKIRLVLGQFESSPEVFEYQITAEVSTVAGSDQGDTDGIGTEARFGFPWGITVDNETLYVVDTREHKIKKISPEGEVITITGGPQGFENGNLETASFNFPTGIFHDGQGSLYVADSYNGAIRKLDPNGNVFIAFHKYMDASGSEAKLTAAYSYVEDGLGNSYVAEYHSHRIVKRKADGSVVIIGSGAQGFADGTGQEAQFYRPSSLAVDNESNVYVADSSNNRIRKITPEEEVSTIAGSEPGNADGALHEARFNVPLGITVDMVGNIYVADGLNARIRKIGTDGIVSTIAGKEPGYRDGIGQEAQFLNPYELAINDQGNILYISDSGNFKVRKIVLD